MPKTAPRVTPRERLLIALDEAIRKVGAQAVLISDLVATRVGINSTDLECLDLLQLNGPITAGQMSACSGLTSGATTAMIDRLERAGYVRRRRDADDRRVVVVEVLEHCGSHIAPLYQPIQKDLEKVHARYTNGELAIVVRYLTEALEAGGRFAAWLQTQPSQSKHHVRLPQEHTQRPARRKKRAPQEST